MIIEERIKFLRDVINEANVRYYVQDNPTLSDFEYDELFRELKKLESENPHLITPESPTNRVGSTVQSTFAEIKHKYRLYSLDNSNSYDELKKWYERIYKDLGNVELVCE